MALLFNVEFSAKNNCSRLFSPIRLALVLSLQLCQMLPGRTVGYPWTLIYSTETHGFSLKTLFREMHDLESPILLVVKDISDNVSYNRYVL